MGDGETSTSPLRGVAATPQRTPSLWIPSRPLVAYGDGFSAQPPGRGLPRRSTRSAPLRGRAAMRRSSVAALRPAGFDLRASLGCVRLVTLPRAPTRLRVRIDLDDDRALQLVSHLLDERRQGT